MGRRYGGDFDAVIYRHFDDIGQVIFALGIVIGQVIEISMQNIIGDTVHTAIDFSDLSLLIAGIFFFDNGDYLVVVTHNTTQAKWVG